METLVYLYVLIGGYNSQANVVQRIAFPSMQECMVALAGTRIDASHGNESENVSVVFCGGSDFQELRNLNFYKANIKERQQ